MFELILVLVIIVLLIVGVISDYVRYKLLDDRLCKLEKKMEELKGNDQT